MPRAYVIVLFASLLPALPAAADHRPVVYPDGTIVHGEWGLHRAEHIAPFAEPPYAIHFHAPDYFAPRYPVPFYHAPHYYSGRYYAPYYYVHRRFHRPARYAPPQPRTYYFPSNAGDPYAYKPVAPRAPSLTGPRYRRSWSTQPNLPADLNEQPMPEGPYVIPAPEMK